MFRDAITITRKPHIQYLWIDSLYIIQDDVEDWKRESCLVEKVFPSAYCTIAATDPRSLEHGILQN